MDDSNETPESRTTHHRKPGSNNSLVANKKLLVTIAVAVVLLIGIWIWKAVQISNLKKEAGKASQALKEQARQEVAQAHRMHLELLAKPYVWAVRTELMRGNINQLNLYANDMVKQRNFQRIAIANNKGLIIASTNKKDEGRPFSTIGTDAALTSDTTSVTIDSDSLIVMTSPIMGFNDRLGTLLIKYTIPPVDF